MKEKTNCVRINGKQVHSIRFEDNIALVAEIEDNMNLILNTLSKIIDKVHMKINAIKNNDSTKRLNIYPTIYKIKTL